MDPIQPVINGDKYGPSFKRYNSKYIQTALGNSTSPLSKTQVTNHDITMITAALKYIETI